MNSNTLTNKQLMILEFIKEQLLSKGYPPSVREICQAVGLKIYINCSLSSKQT